MPERSRASCAGLVCHVLNRAVRRARLFQQPADYAAFLRVLSDAQQRMSVRILAYCVMPNHFHLVAWPQSDEQLSRFMQWLTATHTKRWHMSHGSVGTGPLYQGRFKSFPVQTGDYFLTVCRYVERNALRAGLVTAAEAWAWSSLAQRRENRNTVTLHPWPIPQPANWCEIVNCPEEPMELSMLRENVRVGR